MKLEQQLKVLIDDAANYGVPTGVVELAIAPVLRLFAEQLQHLEYYVLQNLEEDWVLTTIANPQSNQEKKVIYAFVTVQDAATFQKKTNPDLMAMPIPVAQLLFWLFALKQVDSIIFMEAQDLSQGVEIERDRLSDLIRQQIQGLGKTPHNIA
ncbi:hypothetical protein IQ255_19005 [Pleurocapsales cyanobacterium LEGE 10410]|nr:hypothetical protein [Pleurocapsales cyanobacterium LEGE 10410]